MIIREFGKTPKDMSIDPRTEGVAVKIENQAHFLLQRNMPLVSQGSMSCGHPNLSDSCGFPSSISVGKGTQACLQPDRHMGTNLRHKGCQFKAPEIPFIFYNLSAVCCNRKFQKISDAFRKRHLNKDQNSSNSS